MSLKRWIVGVVLMVILVMEVFLFTANRQKESATASLADLQLQLKTAQADLATAKDTSNTPPPIAEMIRLRRENQMFSNQVAVLQFSLAELAEVNQSNAQHLATARLALQLQREHLDELEAAYEQVSDTNLVDAAIIARKTCINNLRLIDDAKQDWALDNNAASNAVPTAQVLQLYLKNGVFPVCPSGGTYSINAVDEVPTCSIPGHNLPE
jgi:hypothetical protein